MSSEHLGDLSMTLQLACGAPVPESMEADYLDAESLTPGIRRTVLLLRSWGYETCDSGDGVTNVAAGMEGARDYPHVVIRLKDACWLADAAHYLARKLHAYGVGTGAVGSGKPAIQVSYDPEIKLALMEVIDLDDSKLPGGAA